MQWKSRCATNRLANVMLAVASRHKDSWRNGLSFASGVLGQFAPAAHH